MPELFSIFFTTNYSQNNRCMPKPGVNNEAKQSMKFEN